MAPWPCSWRGDMRKAAALARPNAAVTQEDHDGDTTSRSTAQAEDNNMHVVPRLVLVVVTVCGVILGLFYSIAHQRNHTAVRRPGSMVTGGLCSQTCFSQEDILVLAGTAGAGGMAPPTSNGISAGMKYVQGHVRYYVIVTRAHPWHSPRRRF